VSPEPTQRRTHWRVERRYGYGAGSVPLCAPPTPRRVAPRPLREGLAAWHRDGSPARTARDFARGLAPPLLAACAMFALLLVFDRSDQAGVAIVPFEELAEPEVVARAPEPEPPPAVPEPPPEPAVPEPEPPAPEPPPVARPQPPPPPPAEPTRPRPQIDRVLAESPPPPSPERARAEPRPERAPQRAAPLPVAFDPLEVPDTPAPERRPARRDRPFAVARADRPAPSVSPAPALAAPPAPDPAPRARRERPDAPRPERRSAPPPPAAAPAAPGVPRPPAPAPARSRRPAAPPPDRRRTARRVAVAVPGVGPVPDRDPARRAAARPAPAPPRPPPAPAAARSPRPDADARIPGVPLGSLAPCVSDARELSLKQRVVATVGERTSCEGPSGRFHFVETRNLNAFLMGIERASGRRTGDRCTELVFALDCLARSSR